MIFTSEATSNLNIFWTYQKSTDAEGVICLREGKEAEEEDLYQTQKYSFNSCLLSSTYWVDGLCTHKDKQKTRVPQGGLSLTVSVNTHPKGTELGEVERSRWMGKGWRDSSNWGQAKDECSQPSLQKSSTEKLSRGGATAEDGWCRFRERLP